MKKSNLFFVLLTALIVMSCSKDETTMSIPQESNAIEFGTYVGRDAQTRASMINTDAQLQAKGFGVFAYYTSERTDGLGSTSDGKYVINTSKPNFMYNQKVEWNTTVWKYEPAKYWPNQVNGNADHNKDYVSFFAYAPYSAAPTGGNFAFTPENNAPGDPTITYTVNDAALSQEDLLWGVNSADGFPFLNQQKQSTTGNIKFQFKHALARIGFNVQAMVDDLTTSKAIADGTNIVVTKVELIGKFYASGALNLNNTTKNVPLWVATVPGTERTFELKAGTIEGTSVNFVSQSKIGTTYNGAVQTLGQLVTNAKETLNNTDSYLMVIPQAFTTDPANALKIRVTYDVITADGKLNTGQSKVTNVITSTPFAFEFVGGKAYSFNLHLGLTSVKFSADVTEWVTKDGDDKDLETVVNVPINTEP